MGVQFLMGGDWCMREFNRGMMDGGEQYVWWTGAGMGRRLAVFSVRGMTVVVSTT